MIDPKQLLEQVLGSTAAGNARNAGPRPRGPARRDAGLESVCRRRRGGRVARPLARRQGRKRGGGLLGYGGAAALGALALQAYQNYQRQQGGLRCTGVPRASSAASTAALAPAPRTAARSSSRSCARWSAPRRPTATSTRRSSSDCSPRSSGSASMPTSKAYIFDLLTHDVDLDALARAAATPEQGAELYLAARLAIDADEPAERAYLDALAARLKLPAELRATLDGTPLPLEAPETQPGARGPRLDSSRNVAA